MSPAETYILPVSDLDVNCYGIPFSITRAYNSTPGSSSARKWMINLEEYAISDMLSGGGEYNGKVTKIFKADRSTMGYYLDSGGRLPTP